MKGHLGNSVTLKKLVDRCALLRISYLKARAHIIYVAFVGPFESLIKRRRCHNNAQRFG